MARVPGPRDRMIRPIFDLTCRARPVPRPDRFVELQRAARRGPSTHEAAELARPSRPLATVALTPTPRSHTTAAPPGTNQRNTTMTTRPAHPHRPQRRRHRRASSPPSTPSRRPPKQPTSSSGPATNGSTGTHSRSTIDDYFGVGAERAHERTFTFDADHPAVLVGQDNGPTPVEFVLHALAACLTAGIANIAAARKVTLDRGALDHHRRHRPQRHPRPRPRGPQRLPADADPLHASRVTHHPRPSGGSSSSRRPLGGVRHRHQRRPRRDHRRHRLTLRRRPAEPEPLSGCGGASPRTEAPLCGKWVVMLGGLHETSSRCRGNDRAHRLAVKRGLERGEAGMVPKCTTHCSRPPRPSGKAVGYANSELARGAHLVTIVATPEGYIAVVADEPYYPDAVASSKVEQTAPVSPDDQAGRTAGTINWVRGDTGDD